MPRAPLLCVALTLTVAGCELPCAEGYGRAADGACYPICWDGLGPGGDSFTDDSGQIGDQTTLGGAFFIDVTESGSNVSDTCVGQINLVYSPSASPVLQGEFACGFNEGLSHHPGASGVLTGTVFEQGNATGELLGNNWLVDSWSGTFINDLLDGRFEGQVIEEGYTLTYSGQFSAGPPQD